MCGKGGVTLMRLKVIRAKEARLGADGFTNMDRVFNIMSAMRISLWEK